MSAISNTPEELPTQEKTPFEQAESEQTTKILAQTPKIQQTSFNPFTLAKNYLITLISSSSTESSSGSTESLTSQIVENYFKAPAPKDFLPLCLKESSKDTDEPEFINPKDLYGLPLNPEQCSKVIGVQKSYRQIHVAKFTRKERLFYTVAQSKLESNFTSASALLSNNIAATTAMSLEASFTTNLGTAAAAQIIGTHISSELVKGATSSTISNVVQAGDTWRKLARMEKILYFKGQLNPTELAEDLAIKLTLSNRKAISESDKIMKIAAEAGDKLINTIVENRVTPTDINTIIDLYSTTKSK